MAIKKTELEAANLPEGAKVDKETGAVKYPPETAGEKVTTASVSEYGAPKAAALKEASKEVSK